MKSAFSSHLTAICACIFRAKSRFGRLVSLESGHRRIGRRTAWVGGRFARRTQGFDSTDAGRPQTYDLEINAFVMNVVADPQQPYWQPGWTDPDANYRVIRREHTIRAFQLAKDLEAASIST